MPMCFIDCNLLLFKFLRPKYTARGVSAPLAHFYSLSSLLRCLYGLCMILAPFRTNFQASLSLAIFVRSFNSNFLQIIVNIDQPSLSWLSKGAFSVWDILKHSLHSFLLVLFVTCPKHRNLPFLIPEIISVSLYRFIHS